jgi:hypothetical protein
MAQYEIMKKDDIQSRIYTIRGVQVMLDSDLARFYGMETKILNQAVKRNIERFPREFSFRLTGEENNLLRSQIVTIEDEDNARDQVGTLQYEQNLRSQIVTSKQKGGRRYLPFVFTEQGGSDAVRGVEKCKGRSDEHPDYQCLCRHAQVSGLQRRIVSASRRSGKKTNRIQGGC